MEPDILMQISGQLGRLEGKVDGILTEQQRIAEYSTSTSTRVHILESKLNSMLGWASGVAGVVALIVGFLHDLFFNAK